MSTRSSTTLYTASDTASSVAYQQLKTLILLGDVPIGIRLREERLAERLGVSRTPVREALLRLSTERFVERHPEGGYRVTNPSTQTMSELYEVRRALEMFALQRGYEGDLHDMHALGELNEEWSTLDFESESVDAEFVHLDEDFHRRLAESAGNRQLAEELRAINERIRPVRTHDFITHGRISTTIEQHLAILDAVIHRHFDQSSALLRGHITESQRVVEVAVAEMLERMLSVEERDSSW